MASSAQPIIFLQGLGTPVFERWAGYLEALSIPTLRVNFCGGDVVFGGASASINWRGPLSDLPTFYADLFRRWTPRAIILFGDTRPVHQPALQAARRKGIPAYVIEEGYLRPGFVTMELGGTNANSSLPQDAEALSALAANLPAIEAPADLPNPMPPRVRRDLLYKLANILGFPFFPKYRTHRPYLAAVEARGWLIRLIREPFFRRQRARILGRLTIEAAARPVYLIPLQLNADSQVRLHSDFGGVEGFIQAVIHSFAAHAPADARLLFKNHPLDNGVINYRRIIAEKATGPLKDRLFYVDGGQLEPLIDTSTGVVVINSTTGLSAAARGRPVKTLGRAIYAISGITHQGSLDSFWCTADHPDPDTVDRFTRVLQNYALVKGDLFSDDGIEIFIEDGTRRLQAAGLT